MPSVSENTTVRSKGNAAQMPKALDQQVIFVVEDEPLIALDIEGILDSIGIITIRVAETLARTRVHVTAVGLPDLAILDVLLPDGESFDLAREFLAGGVRIIFLTGYTYGIPADLRHCPVVEKPFAPDDLKAAVLRLVGLDPPGGAQS